MAQTAGAGDTPAKLFSGYDSIARGMLDTSAVKGRVEQTGGRSTVHIQVCDSVSELASALEIDGSLSVSYLKAVNVTAKMSFMKKLNVTAHSITIVVYASHETGTWSVRNLTLEDGVKAPGTGEESAEEQADFADLYGDSYVSSATQGGEYYAVYTFHTETRDEQSKLKGELKGKGIGAGVTAELKIQGELSNFLKETSINWTFDQEITGHANPALPTQDKLIEFALAFPSKQLDSPVTTGFKIAGYEGVPGIGRTRFKKIRDNRDHFLGEDGVLLSFARLNGTQNQINWLKRIYARYNFSGDPGLLTFEGLVKEDLDKINKQISAYKRDPAATFEKPQLPSLAKGEPVLTYQIGQSPRFGGTGGTPFDFNVDEALRNQVRITSIRLAEGDNVIHCLEVGYASDRAKWTAVHGAGGNRGDLLTVGDGQFPVHFDIRCQAYVDRLFVRLNDGRTTSAGGGGGKPFEWRPPEGYVVLGFSGRAGGLLDQVQFAHAKLLPALYK